MRTGGLIILACAWGAIAGRAEPAAEGKGSVELALKGQPRAIVVIAENPTRAAHVAAREFIHYVQKISGVELPLHVDAAAPPYSQAPRRVLIGESSETRTLGLKNTDFAEQEYLVETRGSNLILMGRDAEEYGVISYEKNGFWPAARSPGVLFLPMGTLYAVHSFLEKHCGVRWYLPGEVGEVCPRAERLLFTNLHGRTKPWTRYRFSSRHAYRDPFHFYGHADPDQRVSVPGPDMLRWMVRMKIGGSPYACCHSFGSYPKRFGEAHPEWWKEGKPTPVWPHPDYANPALIQQATQDALDYFAGQFPKGVQPDGSQIMAAGDYFCVMPEDGRKGLIWSEAGEKLRDNDPRVQEGQEGFSCGWASDFVFNIANQVAWKVHEKYPGKWITCAAYAPYFNPPQKLDRMAPNLAVQQCGWMHRSFAPAEWDYQARNLEAWGKIAGQLYIWEYYLEQNESNFQACPVVFPHQVARTIRFFHATKVRGMFFEASAARAQPDKPWSDGLLANPAEDLLNHYVTWKMLCDASLDVDRLLDEHYRLFYGPAEKPMKEFFTLIEGFWAAAAKDRPAAGAPGQSQGHPRCTAGMVKALEPKIRAALDAAKAEPYRNRVELMYQAIFKLTERKAAVQEEQNSRRRRLACPVATAAPVVDGKLDDPGWKNAAETGPFVSPEGIQPVVSTTARIMRDSENLYIAFNCPEPRAGKTASAPTVDPAKVADDRVEVALDVGRSRTNAWCLTVSPAGAVQGAATQVKASDSQRVPPVQAAAATTPLGWCAEVKVPLATLTQSPIAPGEVWGVNFARTRSSVGELDPEPRLTVWAPTFGAFRKPVEFGVLDLSARPAPAANGLPAPIVHYDFEEIERNQVPDRAGGEVDGAPQSSPAALRTLTGGTPWDPGQCLVPGVKGRALQFGGKDSRQFLEVALAPAVNVAADDFTIAFWYRSARPSGAFLQSTTSKPYWGLSVVEAKGSFALNLVFGGDPAMVTSTQFSAPAPLGDGRWHQIVLAMDRGRNARIYVDQIQVAAPHIGAQKGSLKRYLTIGGPYNYLEGALDEWALYPGAFGQKEIECLYQALRPPD